MTRIGRSGGIFGDASFLEADGMAVFSLLLNGQAYSPRSVTSIDSITARAAKNTVGGVGDITIDHAQGQNAVAAVKEAAEYLKTELYNEGKAMGVWRTGQTLESLTVGNVRQGADTVSCTVSYQGKNRKGRPNAEVAFVNEYGKRGQAARPFNQRGRDKAAPHIEQIIKDALGR